mgnify:CR=1 FL=1
MKPLLVLGSSNIDHIAQMAAFPQAGETLHGERYHRAYGGKGANQAVAAAKSGAPTHFISAFGDDSAGGELRAHLESLHIDCGGSKTVADSTGMAMIWLNRAGENSIVVIAGANAALDAAHVEAEQARIAAAGLLLLQLETPLEGVIRAVAIARAHGVRTILNPAPAAALPPELLANLDLITPNETEAERLTGIAVQDENSAARAAANLHAQGVPTVLIPLGSRGVYASADGHGTLYPASLSIPPPLATPSTAHLPRRYCAANRSRAPSPGDRPPPRFPYKNSARNPPSRTAPPLPPSYNSTPNVSLKNASYNARHRKQTRRR